MTAAIDSQEVPKQPLPSYYSTEDRTERCFVCGMPRYALLHRVTHFEFPFEFYRCECGTIKQVPLPNEAFFEWFFNSEIFFSSKTKSNNEIWGYYDYFADEECRMATSARRYKKLSKFFDRPMKMMKIGPSTGTFLHIAQKHGHHAIGCDISNRFADYARRTYGATIDVGRFEQMPYADGQFDVVLLFNVIENVPNLSDTLRWSAMSLSDFSVTSTSCIVPQSVTRSARKRYLECLRRSSFSPLQHYWTFGICT